MRLRSLAVDAGAKFIAAEPIEFVFEENENRVFPGYVRGNYKPIHSVYVSIINANMENFVSLYHDFST